MVIYFPIEKNQRYWREDKYNLEKKIEPPIYQPACFWQQKKKKKIACNLSAAPSIH